MIFNIDKETLPREDIEALQLRRLQDLCSRVYANVPFYRKRFDESGIKPGDIKSLADLKNLPFTEKQDLRNYYPFGLFAVPRDNIVRLHASSGTTGKAVVVGYTARDLHNWAELAGRSLSAAGVNQTDIVHVAYGYGLFTGGLGAHGGAERIGATVVPASGGATRRQAYLLRDFGATALCCTPSYALHLWEAGQEVGIDFRDLPLRTGVFGAEPWTEEMRQDIERKMGINALNIYGLSEVMGPGVAMECLESKCGMHLWEDHFLPEIIDPVTGERFIANTEGMPPLFQDVFGNTLVELAEANPKIVGVTPAMPSGCSMNILMEKMPKRAFDVGIAEGHAVTFSGGMAKDGLQPFCNIYSSFMQRAHDNIIHDVAIQNLPVVLCLDRAGLVGEDGPTHHGAFDMACLRPIPNLTISSPMDEHELRRLMYTAQLPDKGPFVIRYPRGRGVLVDWKCPLEEIPVGKGRKLKEGSDLAVITIGPIGNVAARAITRAEADLGLSIAHYDLRFLKPLDEELLHEAGRKFQRILTIEDGIIKGGMGSAVLEFMADNEYKPTVKRIGIPNIFVEHGAVAELYQLCGMDEEGILTKIKEFIN